MKVTENMVEIVHGQHCSNNVMGYGQNMLESFRDLFEEISLDIQAVTAESKAFFY